MTSLLNFLVGGGLLALVQAILSAWQLVAAKRAGANAANLISAQKAISDVETAQQISNSVDTLPASTVRDELRQFQRD